MRLNQEKRARQTRVGANLISRAMLSLDRTSYHYGDPAQQQTLNLRHLRLLRSNA
jgi:hypothetical protein